MASSSDSQLDLEPVIDLTGAPGAPEAPESASDWLDNPLPEPRLSDLPAESPLRFPSPGTIVAIVDDPGRRSTASNSILAAESSSESPLASTAPPNAGASRKRPAPKKESTNKRRGKQLVDLTDTTDDQSSSSRRALQLKKVVFKPHMTEQLMLWFQECKSEGLFNSSKKKDYAQVWQDVCTRCKEAWPQYPWTPAVISTKYNTERSRYRVWKALLEYSGVSFNEESQLPEAAESVWEAFFLRHNTPTRNHTWLQHTPLGDPEVYSAVFWREKATGNHIMEAEDIPSQSFDQILDDGEESENDEAEPSGSEEAGRAKALRILPVTPARKLTPAQQHRRDTDPDSNHRRTSGLSVSEDTIAVSQASQQSKTPDAFDTALYSTLCKAASIMAAPRTQGATDLTEAIVSLEALFSQDLSRQERINCRKYLQNNPLAVIVWNALNPESKREMVDEWKV